MTTTGKPRRGGRLAVGAVGILAVAGTVWTIFQVEQRRAMRDQIESLVTLQELRRFALEDYLETLRSEIILYGETPGVRAAIRDMTPAWRQSAAGDGSSYSALHAEIHPRLADLRDHHGYYDIFLVAADGSLVYSVAKEDDFGTNLITGPWRDTGLGRAVQAALEAEEAGFVAFTDFELYEPSAGEPASFIASPVFDQSGMRLGALAFQVPTERIRAILQFTAGMGRTGETYLVGGDYLMRSDSRFADSSTILRTRVETDAVRRAFAGETGTAVIDDYRGVSVLSAFGPFGFEGTTWALIAEIDEREARQRGLVPRRIIGQALLFLGVIGGAVAIGLMVVLGRQNRPQPWTDVGEAS